MLEPKVVEGSAMLSTKEAPWKEKGKDSSKLKDKNFIWCSYCKKSRHTKETCWKIYGKHPSKESNERGGQKGTSQVNTTTNRPNLKAQFSFRDLNKEDLGLRQPRLEGDEYLSIVDEFMEAAYSRWPKAIIQFEDFQMKWAFETLERYRRKFCMFNDDVQGTAGVALAGLLGAVRAQGRSLKDFVKQKIVVVGAGSAGIGVLKMAKQAMERMLGNNENLEAKHQFWVLDKYGLITKERKNIDPAAVSFARGFGPGEVDGLNEGASLVEVVKKVKPDVLLGLSGVGGIFNEEVLKAMQASESLRPAIFAMSNPTANAECTPADAFKYAGENIIFASGSPFENVNLGNGKVGYVNQANNMYLFPGIGLGALLSGARLISDGMLQAAAECLASYMTEDEIEKGILFPSISSIRHITTHVGAAVVRAAVAEDLAEGSFDVGLKELISMSKEETIDYVARNMWYPVYSPLVHEK